MNNEEHVHINFGNINPTEKEVQHANDFLSSDEFKETIEKAENNHRKVMESKITDRTKM